MRESKATGIPLMAVLGLSTLLFAAGCRGGEGGATGHVAAAAQDDPAPKGGCGGYCMGDSWCTNGPNGVCYAPGTPESIKHCGCGFCVGRSWCTCGPDGVCYIPEAQISIDHCGAYARCGGEQECPAGFVCEPTTPQCTDPRCIPGCRVGGAPCGCGLVCNQPLCFTCPCPGQCEPRPCDDGYCMGDSWCTQSVCYAPNAPESINHCGCGFCVGRSWCTCGPNGVCYIPEAQISIDHCGAFADCASEPECPAGFVCEPSKADCTEPKCLPGCRVGGTPCSCGRSCSQPNCLTCPCPGVCS